MSGNDSSVTVNGGSDTTVSIPLITGLIPVEVGLIGVYYTICTILTILLNSFLIFIILLKVKLSRNLPSIPILCASILGLFHGFGCNIMLTISFLNGDWVGSMDWCGAVPVLQKYIVYCIIYCLVVVSLETSYLISHPMTYSRDSTRAKIGIISGTFFAFFLLFPITVCHFFYLKPSNIIETWGQENWDDYGDSVFLYMNKDKKCIRFYWPGTFDEYMIVYFILSTNLIAVFLMALSFVIIISVVLRSRQALGETRQSFHAHERKRKLKRRQNFKIGLRSITLTFCTALPWFPNLVMSIIQTIKPVTTDFWFVLTEITNNLYYIVPWLFPFLAIVTNPAIYRATVGLVRPARVEQSHTANTRC